MDLQTASTIGFVLSAIGAVSSVTGASFYGYATIQNYKKQEERSQKNAEFQKQLTDKQTEITEKQTEIARLNKEIAATAKESNALITGGDSYVYLVPVHDEHVLHFNLYGEGPYPLYDMQIIFDDTQAVIAVGKQVEKENTDVIRSPEAIRLMNEVRRQTAIGNLLPRAIMYNVGGMTWKMGGMDHRSFRIFTASRNGSTFENASVRRLPDGTWVTALRVQRVVEPDPITLKEMIDPNFPRDDKGEPRW